jgi:hypothetical protein
MSDTVRVLSRPIPSQNFVIEFSDARLRHGKWQSIRRSDLVVHTYYIIEILPGLSTPNLSEGKKLEPRPFQIGLPDSSAARCICKRRCDDPRRSVRRVLGGKSGMRRRTQSGRTLAPPAGTVALSRGCSRLGHHLLDDPPVLAVALGRPDELSLVFRTRHRFRQLAAPARDCRHPRGCRLDLSDGTTLEYVRTKKHDPHDATRVIDCDVQK